MAALAVALVVALAGLAVGAGVAGAAPPVPGGRYAFAATGPGGASTAIVLTLADDGGELAIPSGVGLHEACAPTEELDDVFPLDGRATPSSRSVGIRPGGRFSARMRPVGGSRREMVLTGGFVRGGRVATGTLRVREDRPCPDVRVRFRAPLTGRPNAPRPGAWSSCDPVVTGYSHFPATVAGATFDVSLGNVYAIYDRGAGCTTARDTARRFAGSVRCLALAPGAACAVKGATCTATRGGLASPLASAACTPAARPAGRAELVHYQPCTPPATASTPVGAWAVNTGCDAATSFPFEALLPGSSGPGACGDLSSPGHFTCAPVAGFQCSGRLFDPGPPPVVIALCTSTADPFLALRFETAPSSAGARGAKARTHPTRPLLASPR